MADSKKTTRARTAKKHLSTRRRPARGGSGEPRTTSAAATDDRHIVPFPIVGLGASAGGLEALEVFFRAMPADSGMAFVVIVHQHPNYISLLAEILGRCTAMSIHEVNQALRITPNQIYLAPPGTYLALHHATLEPLVHEGTNHRPLPIDYFFQALAEDQQAWAIGIVLSGNGTDGTLGIQAIKNHGGLTIVQESREAKFSGMPHSALATGVIDYILPVAEMPEVLLAFGRRLIQRMRQGTPESDALTLELLQHIYMLLQRHTRHDFAGYKTTTIRRRIERRMQMHQIDMAPRYLQFLRDNPHELDLLFRELLIGVTRFFRDPEAFEALATQVLPLLLSRRSARYPVRVWVAGCSTGEEAYALAILLREVMERLEIDSPIQIFATDLDNQSIEKGRAGIYPEGIAGNVSPERLARFFSYADGFYTIKKDIRDLVIFAQQSIIADPPFTKLDILACRNVLIYLNTTMQRRLLPMFHYALRPHGVLFLGSSETIGSFTDLFTPFDQRWKIFECRDVPPGSRPRIYFPVSRFEVGEDSLAFVVPHQPDEGNMRALIEPRRPDERSIGTLMEKALAQHFAPPSVLVNNKGDVVYIHGSTGMFLQPAPGLPSHNIISMARPSLQADLALALRQAAAAEASVVRRRTVMQGDDGTVTIEIRVLAIADPEPLRGLFLVSFESLSDAMPQAALVPGRKRRPKQSQVAALEHELQSVRSDGQSRLESSEDLNEELQSTNEELQSTNEELQSANEELETAKEEMQSLNEELQIVNDELHAKMENLVQVNDDMQNLLNSTDIATIFLDNQLCIKRFTPRATRVIKVIPSDIGRPVADLASTLLYTTLEADAREVLRTLVFKELEITTHEGQWYYMRLMPYRTAQNVIDGLVITFVDITSQKQVERVSNDASLYAESMAEIMREALVILDPPLRVIFANHAFYRSFDLTPPQVIGQPFSKLLAEQWNLAALQQSLEGILQSGAVLEDFRLHPMLSTPRQSALRLHARRMECSAGFSILMLLTIEGNSRGSEPTMTDEPA